MPKRDLTFPKPIMNAAGTLGFAPDRRAPVAWEDFGAFVTNPLSLRPRRPAAEPALIAYPGGFLLHTGLPNPGLAAALQKYARRWADAFLPIIVHLIADRPEETARMVERLEGLENIIAAELGFAPQLADDIVLIAVEMCLGELPLIVSLPAEQILRLGPRVFQVGAAALSLAPPRGRLARRGSSPVSGRLYGPGLLPQALEVVYNAARIGLPLIAAGGAYSNGDANAMLAAGALAVQMDAMLWLPGVAER